MLLNLGELLTDSLLFFTLSFAAAVTLLAGEQLFSSWRRPPRSSGSPASPGGEGAHDGLRSSQPRSRHRSRRAARTRRRVDARLRALVLCGVNGAAGLATWFLSGYSWSALVPLATGLVVAILVSWILQNFTVAGRLLVASVVLLTLVGVAWGTWFIATLPISTLTRTLMFAGIPLLIIFLPSKLILTLEDWEVLCRKNWLRPREPLPVTPRDRYPKVSLHVPAYSEPPEIVIETLNVLSRLRYPNFEVLVIDNNTKDPSLWQPVEAHCRRLGERFRFFHLEQWPGAKAGALNFALGQTAPDAEVVGVIDADYHAEPDFLSALVGHFDDPRIGFVQSPHDYRGWKESLYQRMCYWEYKIFYWTTMVSYNERDAALTVGTMCLIRRAALEEAGGWAEWCVTEDSELAIRIHALGYSSVYVTKTFGRGLISETFSGYKRQHFRWTYGPVQELKRHYRLSLPRPWGRPSSLSVAQKVDHLNHGLDRANGGLSFLLMPLGVASPPLWWLTRKRSPYHPCYGWPGAWS